MKMEVAIQHRHQEARHLPPVGEMLAKVGLSHIGEPSGQPRGIEHGMSPTEGFSCSGFVTYVCREAGVRLPEVPDRKSMQLRPFRMTHDYLRYCEPVSWKESRRGDLTIFTKRSRKDPNTLHPIHIGMLIERDGWDRAALLHAPGLKDSRVEVTREFQLIPNIVWDQPELLPDYLQIRRIPESWRT